MLAIKRFIGNLKCKKFQFSHSFHRLLNLIFDALKPRMSASIKLVQCILCKCTLKAEKNEVFLGHMQDMHRAYFNLDFMFTTFFLNQEQLEKMEKFLSNVDSLPDFENWSERAEVAVEEDYSNFEEEPVEKGSAITQNENIDELQFCEEFKTEKTVKAEEERKEEKQQVGKLIFETPKPKVENSKKNLIHCKVCDKDILSLKYERHVNGKRHRRKLNPKTLLGPRVCPDCGEFFQNPYAISSHRRSHDMRVFECPIPLCKRKVRGMRNYERHQTRFHKAPEICTECGKSFKKLSLHVKTMHTGNRDKKFVCDECGKGFAVKDKYVEHQMIHTNTKPFQCKEKDCSYSCILKGNLSKHEKKHKKRML